MTDETMNLRALLEKSPGAAHGERSAERRVQRNGNSTYRSKPRPQ
jgi:hypothetical protein